jgi:hypothetical protein
MRVDVWALLDEIEKRQSEPPVPATKAVDVNALLDAVLDRVGPNNVIPREDLKEIIGEKRAATPTCAANKDDEPCGPVSMLRGPRKSWSEIVIYCNQIVAGPKLAAERAQVGEADLPALWFEQQLRAMSRSTLERFHGESLRRIERSARASEMPDPLPLQEARRLVQIWKRRAADPATGEQERVYLNTALTRAEQYISGWNSSVIERANKILETA